MSERILVFGADGQLARELARARPPEGYRTVCRGRRDVDITDQGGVDALVADVAPCAIVNAAAYTAVDAAEDAPEAAFAVNQTGAAHVAAAAARHGVPCLHVSTDYVFDGQGEGAYAPTAPVSPLGVYGRSKEAGERAVREACDDHVIVRTAWVYSPFGHNFVRTMLRVGADRDTLTVVDDQVGNPTAAHAIAAALLAATHSVLRTPAPELRGTYHFASAGGVSWCGFAREIFRQAEARGYTPSPRVDAIASSQWPTKAPRPANSQLDSSAFEQAFGVTARAWPEDLAPVLDELLDVAGPDGDDGQ